jgi:hypothetical protein
MISVGTRQSVAFDELCFGSFFDEIAHLFLLDQVMVLEQIGPPGLAVREFWLSVTGLRYRLSESSCPSFSLLH